MRIWTATRELVGNLLATHPDLTEWRRPCCIPNTPCTSPSGSCATTDRRTMPHASSFTRKTDGYSIVVRLLVIVILVVCMTAPEEVIYPTLGTTALNPYTGTVKTVLFGLAWLVIALCPSRLKVWVIAKPFLLSIAWAFICWIASGAE